jgi:hypothetical protein
MPTKTQLITILKTDLPVHEFAPDLAASLLDQQLKAKEDDMLGEIRLT